MGTGGRVNLRELAERIRAIEQRQDVSAAANRFVDPPTNERIPTGWTEIDAALGGGLDAGGLHEWFGVEAVEGEAAHRLKTGATGRRRWTPPLCILVHLAWQGVRHSSSPLWTLWIGRACHPYPRVLVRGADRGLLERSLFVAPRDASARLWAIDLALRSPAVGVVIADGSGFDRAATQRIQLLARDQSKWALTARPPPQLDVLSAAQTRWRVRTVSSRGEGKEQGEHFSIRPRWSVELLRCKGMQPTTDHRSWLLEWNRVEGAVHLSAGLADLAGAAEKQVRRGKTAS